MKTISFAAQVPVVGKYDVVVCGGGPAGFIAAIAAARNGAKTAVIEQYGFFGGMSTAGLVVPISVFSVRGKRVIGGVPWDFVEALEAFEGGAYVEHPLNNVAIDPEKYKLIAQRMVKEAGVDMYMHSTLTGIQTKNGKVTAVTFQNKNGMEAVEADYVIDCTGDGDVAAWAGVPMQEMNGEKLQPGSFIFCLDGVDTDSELVKDAMHHRKQNENMHSLPVRNKLNEMAKDHPEWPIFGGPWFCTLLRPGCIAINMTRTDMDATDNRDFTDAECRLREDIFTWAKILKENFPEFRNSYVCATATQAGPRETRRIKGMHTITAQEYLTGYEYPDSVSRGMHPIDIHTTDGSRQEVRFLEQAAFVPYRSLIAENFPNLLVAGRCISADRQAFASLRVQASAMGEGQAAGVAAALCVKAGCTVQDVDVELLRNTLKDMGAIL